jgi:diguanylate cyclase (GGDEF)-like protein
MKDPLTGLANRRSVEERLEWIVAENQPHCVIVLDLNGFKEINDKYGHAAGDDLLKKFAHELQKNIRSDDLVGRWGGDEFIVLLNRDLGATQLQVDRMREWVFGSYTIESSAGKNKVRVHVEASVGLAEWLPGKTAKEVIEQADTAMYLDKQASRKTTSRH